MLHEISLRLCQGSILSVVYILNVFYFTYLGYLNG